MAHKCDGCMYKGEHQEMMFRPFGVCTKETNLIEAEKSYNAEKCPYKMTNADRIRAMSNEELYLFAKKQIGCGFDCFPCGIVCDGKCKSFSEEDCREKIMNWLKQPAEET